MIEVSATSDHLQLVLRPNRSMSWRENKYLIGIVLIWLAAIGIGFGVIGAWPVMPFIGIEMLAFVVTLYYVSWKISHCEVVRITSEQIIIEKGVRWPKKTWRWLRGEVRVLVKNPDHPWQAPVIEMIHPSAKSVRVGEFLNSDDCKKLVDHLVAAGLVTRKTYGSTNVVF